MNFKGKRVASEVARIISNLLITEVKDKDLKYVTITHVDVTNDLSFSKIYFTCLDSENKEKVLKDINNASGFFRSRLAEEIGLRHTPELRFIYDESIETGKKIEEILKEINNKEN